MLKSLLLCSIINAVSTFVPISSERCQSSKNYLIRSASEDQAIEATRLLLENQFQDGKEFIKSNKILSGTKRRLVETERNLIQALGTAATDEEFEYAVQRLWELWFSERGTKNLKRLQEIDELISAGRAFWLRAEGSGALCQEQPDWAEPFNRLATLYYLMGRYDESVDLCEKVLSLKPHHFGALSGIIMCHLQRGDAVAAEHWASLNLPNDPDARLRWATRRVSDLDLLFPNKTDNSDDGNDDVPTTASEDPTTKT